MNNVQYVEEGYSFFGDLKYFSKEYIEDEIKKIKEEEEDKGKQSEKIAKVLYDVIGNIGNTCRREVQLQKLVKTGYKYDGVLYNTCNKYMKNMRSRDVAKIRSSINKQFVHKDILKIALGPLLRNLHIDDLLKAVFPEFMEIVADTIVASQHMKLYSSNDMCEALRHYKILSSSESANKETKEKNKKYYNITKSVLVDMLKIYDNT